MKKVYVMPVATSVAFVVNENIAASGLLDSSTSSVGFTHMTTDGSVCNTYFAGTEIPTGLTEGELTIWAAMNGMSEAHFKELIAYLDSIKPESN